MEKISPVVVVIACTFLIQVTIIGSESDFLFYHAALQRLAFGFFGSQVVVYLLYPLLGWISDVYFTRYKVLLLSFIIFIVGSVTFVSIISVGYWQNTCAKQHNWTAIVVFGLGSLIVCLAGLGLFEANAIQFGMDQLLEASSDQLGTFIHWYYWSLNLGKLIVYSLPVSVATYYSECQIHFNSLNPKNFYDKYNCKMYYICLLSIGVIQGVLSIVGLFLFIFNKKHLNIKQPGDNPLRLVYNVLKYSWYHTCPENRSAFTYWEEDIPPRIDLGKNKYGGPFTTEEVEDTKAFLSMVLLCTTLVGFHLSSHGYQLSNRLMQNECPSFWVLMLVGEPAHLTTLTIVIGIPLYQLARHCCYSQMYFPNMLKRMGIGLLCCLAKEITELALQVTQNKENYCEMDIHQTNPTAPLTCYYLASKVVNNLTGNCTFISTINDNKFYCTQNNFTFLLLIIPYVLHGLAYLLVFMTALEFICAQAPLRLKGILIGFWYALLVLHLVVAISETKVINNTTWTLFREVKAFLIAMSFFAFLYVSEHYHYRVRDEVVNEQFLVEEIYEREIHLAAEYEREKREELRLMFGHLPPPSRQQCYDAINDDQDSLDS